MYSEVCLTLLTHSSPSPAFIIHCVHWEVVEPGNEARIYSAPSLESRFLGKLLELLYPLHDLALRSQKWIICTYICLLQCGKDFNLTSKNWLLQGT